MKTGFSGGTVHYSQIISVTILCANTYGISEGAYYNGLTNIQVVEHVRGGIDFFPACNTNSDGGCSLEEIA